MLVSGCISSNNDDDDDDEKVKPGPLVTEDESVDIGTATEVVVNLDQGVGSLDLSSGAAKLMEATFKYNIAQWKPEIDYAEKAGDWTLDVVQPNTDLKTETGAKNDWDVTLTNDAPIDLVVSLGVGDVGCDIGDLDLTNLDLDLGVGDLDLDITSYDGDNLTVTVVCSVGNALLKVPDDMGVRIVPTLVIANIQATGFTMVGDEYHNSVYDPDQPHLVFHVTVTVGDLTVTEM